MLKGKILLIALAGLSMSLVSCKQDIKDEVSQAYEKVKESIAKKSTEKFKEKLEGIYAKYDAHLEEGCDVVAEVQEYTESFDAEIRRFLKVQKEPDQAQKIIVSAIVGPLCEAAVDHVLPLVIGSSGGIKPCLKAVGVGFGQDLGRDLCSRIN